AIVLVKDYFDRTKGDLREQEGSSAERTAYQRTLVPRPCAIRQDLDAWGRPPPALPLLVEKPGRTKDEAPRQWHGQSVLRHVEVEYSDGRIAQEELRFSVVHASPLAQQQTHTYDSAQAKEAEAVADHVKRVHAQWFACEADTAAAIAEYEGR